MSRQKFAQAIIVLSLILSNITAVHAQEMMPFKGGLHQYGFKDANGSEVIPAIYSGVSPFSEGLASVVLNHKSGFIDKTGKEVIPFIYDIAYDFSEGLAKVKLNDKFGFIDKTGKETIPIKYGSAYGFDEGFALVELDGKWGYFDNTGREVIPLKYDTANSFKDGLAHVKADSKYGYIDKTGKEVIPLIYDVLGSFEEDLAVAVLDGKWGFIDKTGKEIIPFIYEDAYGYRKGRAAVVLNGHYGFVDKTGKQVTPFRKGNPLSARFKEDPSLTIDFSGKFNKWFFRLNFFLSDTIRFEENICRNCPYCNGYGSYLTNERTEYVEHEVEHVKKIGETTKTSESHFEYTKDGKVYRNVYTTTTPEYDLVKSKILVPQKYADIETCPFIDV